jgi:4-hydroxy-L-threonine phosphate dehydrogenase PdxA
MLVTFLRTVDSTHVSLREAIERVRPDRELAVIQLAHDALRKLGVESPRVAVAGLNPHAGECREACRGKELGRCGSQR